LSNFGVEKLERFTHWNGVPGISSTPEAV